MPSITSNADAAASVIKDGATVLIGGFGTAGQPMELIDALRRHGAKDLTQLHRPRADQRSGGAADHSGAEPPDPKNNVDHVKEVPELIRQAGTGT